MSETEFDNGWNNIYLNIVPGIEKLLQDLKPKYRLFALTNTNILHVKKWRIKYASVLKKFEKVFCSHEIGARKPENKAYEAILNYLKLGPQSVLFLDDNPDNVKSASEVGIDTILVESTSQMIMELSKLKENGI